MFLNFCYVLVILSYFVKLYICLLTIHISLTLHLFLFVCVCVCVYVCVCVCACIRHLPKLHTLGSSYYSFSRNFQIFKLLNNFLFFCKIHEHSTVFYIYLLFFYEKVIVKSRIGKLNLSEPMKHFYRYSFCYNFLTVVKDFCILYLCILDFCIKN